MYLPLFRTAAIAAALIAASAAPALGQTRPIEPTPSASRAPTQNEGLRDVGRTGNAGTGEVGTRQSVQDAAPNIRPLGRIDSRVQNRVQNRLRNRIDRNYDPTANATSPFEVADEQTTGNRSVRRPRLGAPR